MSGEGNTEGMRLLKYVLVMNGFLALYFSLMLISVNRHLNSLNGVDVPPIWNNLELILFWVLFMFSLMTYIRFRHRRKIREVNEIRSIKFLAVILSIPGLFVLLSNLLYLVLVFFVSVFGRIEILHTPY